MSGVQLWNSNVRAYKMSQTCRGLKTCSHTPMNCKESKKDLNACLSTRRAATTSIIVAKFWRLTLVDASGQPSKMVAALCLRQSYTSREKEQVGQNRRTAVSFCQPLFAKPSPVSVHFAATSLSR